MSPPRRSFHFAKYEDTVDLPNVVVDGSPNASTVLTLTHWPGIAQPPGFGEDTSAEMAFRYLITPPDHSPASIVTNNHFDQDGLVGIHALIFPNESLQHREQLCDVAHGGDFGTYRHRAAARASMAIWSYAQRESSPLGAQLDVPYADACSLLYEETLPLLLPMIVNPERFRALWNEEDQNLTSSERALAEGAVVIEEVNDLDLAIATLSADLLGGHRFASDTADFIHPMALYNATRCCRVLLIRGHEYRYLDRYETWVQYVSRPHPQRVDMAPLARQLTVLETGSVSWASQTPSNLTPTLAPDAASSISNAALRDLVIDHLRNAAPAWDPKPQ